MKNILIISQARYASTRLPGKVLLTIRNKPLLWYLLKRLELVKTPNQIIIATSTSDSNKPLLDYLREQKINYYAGDENDVLDRFYRTAKHYSGEIIVRITTDCPLIDSTLIDILQQKISVSLRGLGTSATTAGLAMSKLQMSMGLLFTAITAFQIWSLSKSLAALPRASAVRSKAERSSFISACLE